MNPPPAGNPVVVALQASLAAELIETHISWVLLAGDSAFKIKKPVNFGFLDFSTLEKRRHFCHEEVRLNRRLAPDIYLGVTAITGTADAPQLDGAEPAIEYAVRMRRFPEGRQMDALLEQSQLPRDWPEALARHIARFHAGIDLAPPLAPWGEPAQVHIPTRDNFTQILAGPLLPADRQALLALQAWCDAEHAKITPLLRQRQQQGFIRECHGDMHLGNMAWVDDNPLIFDGIEFSESLRWIDILSDIAFLLMDIQHRGHPMEAQRVLNAWLAETGDYAGLPLLRYYLVYRTLVRAKIAVLRLGQTESDPVQHAALYADFQAHVALAGHFTRPSPPFLLITHGLSGSGKSSRARAAASECGAIHLRSDIERKRLFSLSPLDESGSSLKCGIYAAEATRQTYRRLAELALSAIRAGYPVIVDATFLCREERQHFFDLARQNNLPFAILACEARPQTLRERIIRRKAHGNDPSEATEQVLDYQLAHYTPLDEDELALSILIDTEAPPDNPEHLGQRIMAKLQSRARN